MPWWKAYHNDLLQHDAGRIEQLTQHFNSSAPELLKTGVTRQLLWQEYIGQHPDGFSYSRYCYLLKEHLKSADVSMHMEYQPGDRIMIDFASKYDHDRLFLVDENLGELLLTRDFSERTNRHDVIV